MQFQPPEMRLGTPDGAQFEAVARTEQFNSGRRSSDRPEHPSGAGDAFVVACLNLKDSSNPILRAKAQYYPTELRHAHPVCLPGRLLGSNAAIRRWIGDLEQCVHAELGRPSFAQSCKSLMAGGAALWTGLAVKRNLFQYAKLQRTTYRLLENRWNAFHLWLLLASVFHHD